MTCFGKIEQKIRISSPTIREALAEFLGTFVLMMFADGSVAQFVLSKGTAGSPMSIYWAFGVGIMMGVYVSGGVSGGHINPAVTLAQACLGRCSWKKVPAYMIGQYLGSFLASCLLYLVYYDALNHFDHGARLTLGPNGTAGIWATFPQPYISISSAFIDQVVGAAMLVLCIMAITDSRNMFPHKGLVPVVVGLVVFGIALSLGLNCAFAINPARDLAPRIFTLIGGWGVTPFTVRNHGYFWVPVVGPHLGAIIGAVLYQILVGIHFPDTSSPVVSESYTKKYTVDNNGFTIDEIDIKL